MFSKIPKWEDLLIILLLIVLVLSTAGYFLRQGFGRSDFVFQVSSEPMDMKRDKGELPKGREEIIVHLSGSVMRPGVYQLKEGDRVIDLLKRGGGGTLEADLDQLNLAALLYDGQKVHIVKKGSLPIGESVRLGETWNTTLININTSSQSQLEELPGVGPTRAKAIIDYRTREGFFSSKEELMNVSGIGAKTFESLKDLISIY